MRIIAFSDIHANLPALESVLAAVRGTPDLFLVAGDLVAFGPNPREVVDLLRSRGCLVVKGNVDDYVADPSAMERFYRCAREMIDSGRHYRLPLPLEVFPDDVAWTRRELGDRLDYLSGLPFSISIEPVPGRVLKMVHANTRDMTRSIRLRMPEAELLEMTQGLDCDILVFGHHHIPFVKALGPLQLVNVASVGLPWDGETAAAYTEITFDHDGWHVQQHRIAYAIDRTAVLIERSTMPHKEAILRLLRTAKREPAG
jgi:predicted phosphodiesterase